ncbi:hypothetical protein [Microbacterium sp. 2FI]|uniref:hypothetical protein n=1 Tax=Microbacterium sp. 2FI TaxID=2502193 RepID=UPI0010F8CB08|nr:hypothetical protein [Microbacterium sp. 2FI]
MNARPETRTAGRRVATRVAAIAAAATLLVGLTACQTGAAAQRGTTNGPAPRPAAVVPEGIDTSLSADRIAEAIARQQAAYAERFRGVPADRIEEILQREAAE